MIIVLSFITFLICCFIFDNYQKRKIEQNELQYERELNERREKLIVANKSDLLLIGRKDYPTRLDQYIGHTETVIQLKKLLHNYNEHGHILNHILLFGPGGLGKTTLAEILANEVGKGYIAVIGEQAKTTEDVDIILNKMDEGTILFIDEVHNIPLSIAEYFYSVLQDFKLNKGSTQIEFPRFTLIGATTNQEKLPDPFLQRISFKFRLEKYTEEEINTVLPFCLPPHIDSITDRARETISKVSQGTIRIARNEFLVACTAEAIYQGKNIIDGFIVNEVIRSKGIDRGTGLNKIQIEVLKALSNGNAIGCKNLAYRVGVGSKELEDYIEPYLLRGGFIERTLRGRTITELGKSII